MQHIIVETLTWELPLSESHRTRATLLLEVLEDAARFGTSHSRQVAVTMVTKLLAVSPTSSIAAADEVVKPTKLADRIIAADLKGQLDKFAALLGELTVLHSGEFKNSESDQLQAFTQANAALVMALQRTDHLHPVNN